MQAKFKPRLCINAYELHYNAYDQWCFERMCGMHIPGNQNYPKGKSLKHRVGLFFLRGIDHAINIVEKIFFKGD